MCHFLVTGGAGFIGSHLVDKLCNLGHSVTVLDNLTSGHERNISSIDGDLCSLVVGDVRDAALVDSLVEKSDGVFHLAALVSVPSSIENPLESFSNNLLGTLNIFESVRKYKNKKIVFASSAAVYGNCPLNKISESAKKSPLSPYGLHKLECENHALMYADLYGIDSVALRFFNVYGPRQDPRSPYSGVISIFINNLIAKKKPKIFGDGLQSRDFIYVEDVVSALVCAMENKKHQFDAYNVGRGVGVSIIQTWSELLDLSGEKIDVLYCDQREGDILHSVADIEKIEQSFNFYPSVDLKSGLSYTYHWSRSNK